MSNYRYQGQRTDSYIKCSGGVIFLSNKHKTQSMHLFFFLLVTCAQKPLENIGNALLNGYTIKMIGYGRFVISILRIWIKKRTEEIPNITHI